MTTGLDGGVMVLVPRGHLHAGDESDALEREIVMGFARGAKRLVVDLSQTRHLSARSIGILAHAHVEASGRGGYLKLRGVGREHRLALEVTGLLGVIEVLETVPQVSTSIRAA